VTIVEARRDQRVGKDYGRGGVERGSELTKLAKLKGGSLANGGDVVGEGKVVVKGDAEVTGGSGGRDRGLLEEEMALRRGKVWQAVEGCRSGDTRSWRG